MTNICSESGVTAQDPTDTGGQIVHRFVNNFHIHQGGERVVCSNCGDEKACLRCSKVGKKQCEICGMWISSHPTHVAYHQRVHSRDRTFRCDRCPASFTRNYVLQIHKRIHTGEKHFLCEVCGLQFGRKDTAVRHQASIHSDERMYDCKLCDKAFNLRYKLMDHMRRVHGYAYTCPECRQTFGTRNEFSAHHSAVHVRDAELMNQPAEITSKMDGSWDSCTDSCL